MALTPISLFQAQGSGIAQFLQGGQNALASALNGGTTTGSSGSKSETKQK